MTDDLAERRKAVGLSQQKLAQLAECSLAMVSLFERGYRPETSEVLDSIVRVIREHEQQAA